MNAGKPTPVTPAVWGGLILVFVAAAWLHAPALDLPFFADDYLFLDQVRHRSLPATLASGDPLGNFFRPVGRQLHFWWLSHASGESPAAFHAANIGALLLIIAFLFFLARRLAGARAALVAAGFFALHYAADVPIRWASGSQDLLAVLGALAALLLYARGLRWPAAIAYFAALLSKETVVLAPLIAVVLDRHNGTPWRTAFRRAWPLGMVFVAWALLWMLTANRLQTAGSTVEFSAFGALAALVHLVQVVIGFEWAADAPFSLPKWPPLIPVVLTITGVLLAWRFTAAPPAERRLGPAFVGLAWVALGAVPVMAVVSIWSAYYYLFALCGAAIIIGVLLARLKPVWVVAALVLLAWTSHSGRTLNDFSTSTNPWNMQSHVNRFYVERSLTHVARYLDHMKRARPSLPSGSTVFFSGVPGFVAWQAADGPLVRWAYRDSSLRSYYLSTLTFERAVRGSVFSFFVRGDSLHEDRLGPGMWKNMALGLLLDGRPQGAIDALRLEARTSPGDRQTQYWLGFLRYTSGDTSAATMLRRAGVHMRHGPAPEIQTAFQFMQAGDTTAAVAVAWRGVERHGLDAGMHALLADLLLVQTELPERGYFEAYAAHALAPDHPDTWRRWGIVLARTSRHARAIDAFERYQQLGGPAARDDAAVERWLTDLRRRLPSGDLARQQMRSFPGSGAP